MIQLLLRLEMLKFINSSEEKLRGIHVESNFPLTITSRNFAKKPVINFYALARISTHMNHNKLRILMSVTNGKL